jgi:hypothetical protein
VLPGDQRQRHLRRRLLLLGGGQCVDQRVRADQSDDQRLAGVAVGPRRLPASGR